MIRLSISPTRIQTTRPRCPRIASPPSPSTPTAHCLSSNWPLPTGASHAILARTPSGIFWPSVCKRAARSLSWRGTWSQASSGNQLQASRSKVKSRLSFSTRNTPWVGWEDEPKLHASQGVGYPADCQPDRSRMAVLMTSPTWSGWVENVVHYTPPVALSIRFSAFSSR